MSGGAAAVREEVVALLAELLPLGFSAEFGDTRPLVEAGLDSVGVLALVAELEGRLGVPLDGSDLTAENLGSLGALCALVARRREGA